MGFDLKPRNKDAEWFRMGAFSWSWMLDAGVGLPLGYGPGVEPGSFVFSERKDGLCIGYNDGARVTAKEARQMAQVARWVANYQDHLNAIFERQDEATQKHQLDNHHRLYKTPVRRDFVEKTRAFADWAEKSGGFRVY